MDIDRTIWQDRKVLVTGHTGFKGSWLVVLLNSLGAKVHGLSLPSSEERNLYSDAGISRIMQSEIFLDINARENVQQSISDISPEYVFHLAAQALVLKSYEEPLGTFDTNVVGALNVINASLSIPNLRGVTVVTSDKVYENSDWVWGYRENDKLGGADPYSASKSALEILTPSLVATSNRDVPFTTVRAGNVIGGGDWALNRLMPDLVRAVESNSFLHVRNMDATRPWQYVLDCLRGYLLVGQSHLQGSSVPRSLNFGPSKSLSVRQVINIFEDLINTKIRIIEPTKSGIEHKNLGIDSSLARATLGWEPLFDGQMAISETMAWYLKYLNGEDSLLLMEAAISNYLHALGKSSTS